MCSLFGNSLWIGPILVTASLMTAKAAFAAPWEGNSQEVQLQTGKNLAKPDRSPTSDRRQCGTAIMREAELHRILPHECLFDDELTSDHYQQSG